MATGDPKFIQLQGTGTTPTLAVAALNTAITTFQASATYQQQYTSIVPCGVFGVVVDASSSNAQTWCASAMAKSILA